MKACDVDPNGQASVSYIDDRGRTIAPLFPAPISQLDGRA